MPELEYAFGESIECLDKNVKYPAKISKIINPESSDPIYLVHFKGFSRKYDVKVHHTQTEGILFKLPPEEEPEPTEPEPTEAEPAEPELVEPEPAEPEIAEPEPAEPELVEPEVAEPEPTSQPEDENGVENPACNIVVNMPNSMLDILDEDERRIEDGFVRRLPATHTADHIIKEYIRDVKAGNVRLFGHESRVPYSDTVGQRKTDMATMMCTVQGLLDYFNVFFNTHLIYSSEREHFEQFVIDTVGPRGLRKFANMTKVSFYAAEYYGLAHLLLLIEMFPAITEKSISTTEKKIEIGLQTFVNWLAERLDDYTEARDFVKKSATEIKTELDEKANEPGPSHK